MTLPLEGWVETAEVRLHYWEWPKGGPTVVLVHGLSGNGRCWDRVAESLLPHFRVIAVDRRGSGRSDKPEAGQYSLSQHVADLDAVVAHVSGAAPVVMLGWAQGSNIAIAYAARHPDAVSHLGLMQTLGDDVRSIALKPEGLAKSPKSSPMRFGKRFASLQAYFDYLIDENPYLPWTDEFREYFFRFYAEDVESFDDGSVAVKVPVHAIQQETIELAKHDMEADCRSIRQPSVMMWAPLGVRTPDDLFISRASQEEILGWLPNCRGIVTVDGANNATISFLKHCTGQIASTMRDLVPTSVNAAV